MHRQGIAILFVYMAAICAGISGEKAAIGISGLSSFEFGQMVKGSYQIKRGLNNDHTWMSRMQAQALVDAEVNEHVQVLIGLEGELFGSFNREYLFPLTNMVHTNAYPTQAEGIVSAWSGTSHPLALHVGYFPYKYNEDAQNLGEYLLRSRPYPQIVITEFDFALARRMGIWLNSSLGSMLEQDFMIVSATDYFPIWDFSVVYNGNLNLLNKFLHIGAGVNFNRMLAVDNTWTNPRYGDSDPRRSGNKKFYIENGDTLIYPLSGIQTIGRFGIHPQALLKWNFLGEKDLKLYAEAAILGLKNYPMSSDSLFGYENILDRIPIMFGFNFPTFKILDVCALEAEHWSNPYPNSLEDVLRWNQASPGVIHNGRYTKSDYKNDGWKWSIYARKMLLNSFHIIFQAACDHSFTRSLTIEDQDFEEAYRKKPDQWYWMLKFMFTF